MYVYFVFLLTIWSLFFIVYALYIKLCEIVLNDACRCLRYALIHQLLTCTVLGTFTRQSPSTPLLVLCHADVSSHIRDSMCAPYTHPSEVRKHGYRACATVNRCENQYDFHCPRSTAAAKAVDIQRGGTWALTRNERGSNVAAMSQSHVTDRVSLDFAHEVTTKHTVILFRCVNYSFTLSQEYTQRFRCYKGGTVGSLRIPCTK